MAQLSNTIINGKLKVNGTIEGNATSANSATTASKLSNTSAIGSLTVPVYFSANGVPVSCSTTLGVSITGNATSATSLQTSAGSSTVPVYFSGGKPVQCSGTLNITSADSNKLGTRPAADYLEAFNAVSTSGSTLIFTKVNGSTQQATISVTVSGTSDSANAVKIENKSNSSTTGYLVGVSSTSGTYQSLYTTSKILFNTSTGLLTATTFSGAFSGNATTATALKSNAGSTTLPVYFSGGKPVACSTTLGVSITGTATRSNEINLSYLSSEVNNDLPLLTKAPISGTLTSYEPVAMTHDISVNPNAKYFKVPGYTVFASTFDGNLNGTATKAGEATIANTVKMGTVTTSSGYIPISYKDNTLGYNTSFKYDCSTSILTVNGITINGSTKVITATTFSGAFSGNATTATALTTNAGNTSTPVYFSNGKPVACGHAFTSYLPLAGGTLTGTLNTKKIVVQGANASLNIENISASIDYAKIETPTDRALHLQAPSNTYLVVGDTTYSTDRTNKYKFIVNGISKFNPPANVANTAQSTIIIGTANGKQITIGKDKYGSSVITADIFNGTASGADHSDTSEVAYTVKSNELSNSDGNCKILVRDDKTDSNANVLETGITVNASTKVINLNGYTIPGLGGGSSSSSTSEVQYGHSKITSNFMLNPYVYYYIYSEQTGENYEVYLSSDQMGYCTKFKMISGVPHFQLGPCSNGVLTSVELDIVCEKVGTKMYRFLPTHENGMSQYAGFPVAPVSTNSVYFVNVSTTPYTVNNSKSVVFYNESNIQPNVLPNQTLTYELFNTGLYVFYLKPSSATDEFSINIKFAPLKCEDKYLGRPIFFVDGDQNKFANYIYCDIDTVSNSSDSTTPVLTNILLIHQKGVMNFKSFAIEVTDTAVYAGFLNEI